MKQIIGLAVVFGLIGFGGVAMAAPISANLDDTGAGKVLEIAGEPARQIYEMLKVEEGDSRGDGSLLVKVGPNMACKLETKLQKASCRIVIWESGEITPGIASPQAVPKPSSFEH